MVLSTAPIGKLTHDNYTAGATATKTTPSRCTSITISNTDTTNSINLSFDGGATQFTIGPQGQFGLNIQPITFTYKVTAVSGSPAVQCLYGTEV